MSDKENINCTREENINEILKQVEKARNDEKIELFVVAVNKNDKTHMNAIIGTVHVIGVAAETLLTDHPEVVMLAQLLIQTRSENVG